MWSVVAVIVVMLLLSAFFSGMETAFISSNRLKLELERKHNRVLDFIADIFVRNSGQYITTILVGNNIALVVYSLYVSRLYYGLSGGSSVLVETLLATVVIIFVAEFIPKAVVLKNPNFYFKTFAVPVYFFYVLLYPIAKLTTLFSEGVMRLFGREKTDETEVTFDRVELAHLVENSSDENNVEHEIKIFQNVLDFPDLTVRDCMIPRIDIEAVDMDASVAELTRRFIDSKYSRIFVWKDSIDNIVGYVNIKSLFAAPQSISQVLMDVDYVVETMPAQQLMTEFIKKNSSIAVVIDEYGGTAGIISLEDILEEIFGEIEDEHDSQDLVERRIADGEYVFSCRLEVGYLNEKYSLDIRESDEYDTLAGYIIFNYDGIPSNGEVIRIDNLEIKILKTTSSKIELARVKSL